jgi:RNA recognition motif-containing protein
LKALFKNAGPVDKFIIIKDPEGKSKGFGFVHFKLSTDAERASKELNKKEIKGRKLNLELVKKGYKHDKIEEKPKVINEIMVRGLSWKKNFTDCEKLLQSTFSSFGKIKNIKIPANKDDKTKHLGYAFIEFLKSNSAAQAVVGVNGKMIDGLEFHVGFKMSRDEYLKKKESTPRVEKQVEKTVVKEVPKKLTKQEDGESGNESEDSDANDDQLMKDFMAKLVPEEEKPMPKVEE